MALLQSLVCRWTGCRPRLGTDSYADGHAERTLRCQRCGRLLVVVEHERE